jgi:hypothetical protein
MEAEWFNEEDWSSTDAVDECFSFPASMIPHPGGTPRENLDTTTQGGGKRF